MDWLSREHRKQAERHQHASTARRKAAPAHSRHDDTQDSHKQPARAHGIENATAPAHNNQQRRRRDADKRSKKEDGKRATKMYPTKDVPYSAINKYIIITLLRKTRTW